jgi:hypothetical protein
MVALLPDVDDLDGHCLITEGKGVSNRNHLDLP